MKGHRRKTMKSRVNKIDSEESWNSFITQGCLVMVHFTAAWCMPSVAMNNFFEELALSHKDVMFLVVDVDEVKEVATMMEIKAMPTFLMMKKGAQIDKLVGANPEEIKRRINGFVQSINSDEN